MRYLALLLVGLFMVTAASCQRFDRITSQSKPTSHKAWDDLLKQYVTPEGNVNYKGFLADSLQLNQYLAQLSEGFPTEANWAEPQRLAYWINAYNAFTIQLIIRNYPVESIKDIGPSLAIPFVNSVWDAAFIQIEGQLLTLNDIEHRILRKEFEEPRIHFAINCASKSCPPLRNEAYTADKLEKQLQEQAVQFINDAQWNQLSSTEVSVSKIFSWFKGDFTTEGTLIDFLNRYAAITIRPDAPINYLPYDWNLNE